MQSLVRAVTGSIVVAVIAACGGGGGGGPAPLAITSTTADDGVVGVAYSETIAATGGSGTRTFSISAGALPAGLAISTAGAISGTPSGPAGTASFTVSVADSANPPQTDTQALTIDIVDPLLITTASLSATAVGAVYAETVVAAGGTAPYDFTISLGTLPSGLALSAAGVITGTVSATARSETFTVLVADSSSPQLAVTQEYTISVALEITTTTLPDATGGVAYSASLEAQGGLLPLTWSITAGALPAGLSGNAATGEISGTPDAVCVSATAVFTAQVTDSATPPATDTQATIDLTVNPALLDITNNTLPSGVIGTAYNASVLVSGGVPPYAFAVTAGTLPSQLALDAATGAITGTPDTIETQSFDITVTDSCPDSVTETLSITINAVSLGRNDSVATATTLPGNGTYAASISPSGHPNTVLEPDEDYYEIATTAASTVTVDINADVNGSPLDSVIEIVNASGVQLNTCVAPTFTSPCFDDDEVLGVDLDSFLEVQVSGATTIYIHVVDFGSNARPDKLYDLVISGVN